MISAEMAAAPKERGAASKNVRRANGRARAA
jgi:hypothetical protein